MLFATGDHYWTICIRHPLIGAALDAGVTRLVISCFYELLRVFDLQPHINISCFWLCMSRLNLGQRLGQGLL